MGKGSDAIPYRRHGCRLVWNSREKEFLHCRRGFYADHPACGVRWHQCFRGHRYGCLGVVVGLDVVFVPVVGELVTGEVRVTPTLSVELLPKMYQPRKAARTSPTIIKPTVVTGLPAPSTMSLLM